MIMYGYRGDNKSVGMYELAGGTFRYKMQVAMSDLRSDIATLLKVKARLAGHTVCVYLDDEGAVIDTPEELPL